jgi:ribose transport system substrate-binding protein
MTPRRGSGRTLGLFAAAVLAASCASCQKSLHEKTERYILVAANVNLPYWQEAEAGFKDAARTIGVKAEFTGPATYSPDEELKAFQNAVTAGPAGILVSPARAKFFQDAIDSAVRAGIPVICIDSDSPESRRILFIGTDNYRAGVESARHMANLLHGSGRVLLITILAQLNLNERLRGVLETFGQQPIEITEVIDDEGDPGKAEAQTAAVFDRKEKIDGILCLEASGGAGAAKVLQRFALSGKIPIVAMDKDPDTLDWIKKGVISVTIAQKPYAMSYYGLKFLDDLHHNIVHQFSDWRTAPASPLPTWVDTGTAVVDKDSVEAFQSALVAERQLR